jgi:hypothetical protein
MVKQGMKNLVQRRNLQQKPNRAKRVWETLTIFASVIEGDPTGVVIRVHATLWKPRVRAKSL